MLQAISPTHDPHTIRTTHNSLTSLTASLRDGKHHLLLAATGSVATIKLPLLLRHLSSRHSPSALSIRVILTPSALPFLAGQSAEQPPVSSLSQIPCVDAVYENSDEWETPWKRGRGVLHIELRRWADLLVIAPLSANSMAGIVGGFAGGLVGCVVRAWDWDGGVDEGSGVEGGGDEGGEGIVESVRPAIGEITAATATTTSTPTTRPRIRRKRIIVAPAMNTAMWRHPVTKKHIAVLEGEWGVKNPEVAVESGPGGEDGWFEVIRPAKGKTLACGDVGEGAMVEWEEIARVVERRLGLVPREGGAGV